MTYVQTTSSSRRMATISAVAILHAGLGYALVTGLAATFGSDIPTIFQAYNVPAAQKDKTFDPPTHAVRTPIRHDVDQTLIITTATPPVFTLPPVTGADTGPTLVPLAPPVEPPAALLPAMPRNDPASWIGQEDYPIRAIREGREGTTRIELSIDVAGKVSSCLITASSGHTDLDAVTCQIVSNRARFKPARDASGNKVAGRYAQAVHWEIPG